MLADSAADVADALATLGEASFEYKLDGARIQVHKVDDEVRVYSRNLRDVTAAVPEVVAVGARDAGARDRARRRSDRAAARRHAAAVSDHDAPLRPEARRRSRCAQSCRSRRCSSTRCIVDGDSADRRAAGAPRRRRSASRSRRRTWCRGSSPANPERGRGVRGRGARRRPRRRDGEGGRWPAMPPDAAGQAWLKVKQARTLDLVVLAVEWGSGRRPRDAEQPAPRRARPRARRVRDARQDVQGPDRRDARVADAALSRARDRPRRATPCTCGRKSSPRSRSTRFRRARNIRAGWRCASRASSDIGTTRPRRMPTPSPPSSGSISRQPVCRRRSGELSPVVDRRWERVRSRCAPVTAKLARTMGLTQATAMVVGTSSARRSSCSRRRSAAPVPAFARHAAGLDRRRAR